ncbi:MAG TPA: AraC family transcriptional regulator, partial [Thermoleophilaceae bacterium]
MRRIAILVFDGVQVLDVAGPTEVFSTASSFAQAPAYDVQVVAAEAGPVRTSSVGIVAERAFASVRGQLDTLLIAGGEGVREAAQDECTLRWVKAAARRSRRVASVCSGSFLLAEAGLLDGRRATTHWAYCDLMQSMYPAVEVDPDPIFVRDGQVSTSAGVTAGMDLALAFVEEDLGRELALEVARQLVLFLKRPGGQAQFSAQLAAQLSER